MIQIPGNEISEYYMEKVLPSWHSFGYSPIPFDAVVPETVSEQGAKIKFGVRKQKWKFTETEKAIWYSHFNLWQHCLTLDRPIIIIEHDCMLMEELPDFSEYELLLFCLFHENYGNQHIKEGIERPVSPCGGYYLTPRAAKCLTYKALCETITTNVDWTVHEAFVEFVDDRLFDIAKFQKYLQPYAVAYQYYEDHIGNTIDHKFK
jgi:GR25 family glycosyltransferase involved in LPS biosynthesis